MNSVQKLWPWIVGVMAIAYLASVGVRAARHVPDQVDAAARLPVCADGRVKPFDSFARNTLIVVSGRQTYDAGGRRGSAAEWMLELMSNPELASTREVVRIDHPDVVSLLGFADSKRVRFSLKELAPKFGEIQKQADLAGDVPSKQRDAFQRQIVDLANRLMLVVEVANLHTPLLVAPLSAGEEWRGLAPMIEDQSALLHPSSKAWMDMLGARMHSDQKAFADVASAYEGQLASAGIKELDRAGLEVIFNGVEPFYQASGLYVAAFLLASLGFLFGALSKQAWARSFARATMAIIAIAFVVHTFGIAARIYLQGRPPVTNLYSSAVFIGWACIPLALVGEWFYKLGIGSAVASLIGFGTLVVAHNLSGGGDTMEMMQAVLDSNFWLATHVVVVTIGYSATFLAGFMAAAYIVLGVLTPWLRGEPSKALPKMTYGVICFACITSFVGTVLGGIWADQSWGRFWGWDPKENGAALIVLMNLIILHARWGGMAKERGVAIMAVFGNIVTAWSWFGTNMLGVGLHSYGFMDSAVFWLLAFCGLQLVIMAIGLVPTKKWRSIKALAPTATVLKPKVTSSTPGAGATQPA